MLHCRENDMSVVAMGNREVGGRGSGGGGGE